MPVRKFRSVAEMSGPDWLPVGPALWRALDHLHAIAEATSRPRFPPGVYKHRRIEDAQRLCEAWRAANAQRLQAERDSAGR